MRFAHMSDCHLGSWSNHPDLKELPLAAFEQAIGTCITERVDFIIIAGDLFDTALPSVDATASAAGLFARCRASSIPVYVVPGSHDYSPTNKTMLTVFEAAGLLTNVARYEDNGDRIRLDCTVDHKTGTKLVGYFGKKGGLDDHDFERFDIAPLDGFKIFVFHSAIRELNSGSPFSRAVSLNQLPTGFNYYATGHVHTPLLDTERMIAFPGPLFPADFHEMEHNADYGFFIVDCNGTVAPHRIRIRVHDTFVASVDATSKTHDRIEHELRSQLSSATVNGKIVLLKVHGTLSEGSVSDIDLKGIMDDAMRHGAITVKRNIHVEREETETLRTEASSVDEIEHELIDMFAQNSRLAFHENPRALIYGLLESLNTEKMEDETTATFEERVLSAAQKLLDV